MVYVHSISRDTAAAKVLSVVLSPGTPGLLAILALVHFIADVPLLN